MIGSGYIYLFICIWLGVHEMISGSDGVIYIRIFTLNVAWIVTGNPVPKTLFNGGHGP